MPNLIMYFSFANLGYVEAWGLSVAEEVERHIEDDSQLGASPAELDWNPEIGRQRSWHSFDGEAELRLNDTVYDC